jgi:GLPGLI family protein
VPAFENRFADKIITMQKILLAVLFLPAALGAGAQTPVGSGAPVVQPAGSVVLKEGRVIYERKVNMYRRMKDESMKSMIPEFNTSKVELDFLSDASVYKNVKEAEDIRDQAGQDDNRRVFMRFGGGDNDQTYKDYATEKYIEQRELGPKKYLIVDTLKRQSWKLEAETRTIKGYTCKKALTKGRDSVDIVAWYAEDIQSAGGPEAYGGLPGLILELNINNAEIVYTTLDIVTKDFDKGIVKAPTEGKKITRAEFRKMMEDTMGGPGQMRISIRRD